MPARSALVRLRTAQHVRVLSAVLAHRTRGTDFYQNGPVCVGTTRMDASDSLLESTGQPSERLGRRWGQRARSRFRVPAEVYAGASYLNSSPQVCLTPI